MKSSNGKSAILALLLALPVLVGAAGATVWAQSNPVPFVNNPLVPGAIAPGSQGFTLTVNGAGFVSGSTVYWNGSPRTTQLVSQGQLTASISAADVSKPGTAAVTVVSPSPGGGTSLPAYFEVARATRGASFGEPSFGTGAFPLSGVTGDFNGDGIVDLAVADYSGQAVSVLLGKGDGTFQPHVDYPLDGVGEVVGIGDFNGDGRLDLAVAADGVNGFAAILFGNGDGTFQPAQDYIVSDAALSITTGDFNGDGKLDLAVSMYTQGVAVLLGNGDGTFESPVNYPDSTAGGAYGITAGDFNGDGKLDLAVAVNLDNAASVLLGNGDGSFQPYAEYPTARGPKALVAADFNGDSKLDLAVANQVGVGGSGSALSVLLGNGDGTFQSHTDYSTLANSYAILATDLNADGKLDLVAASNTSNAVQTFLGMGDGTFRQVGQFASGIGPGGIIGGDFNGDGRLDLATVDGDSTAGILDQLKASLSQTFVNFGALKVGSTKSQAVTLTNVDRTTLSITKITLTGGFGGFSEVTTCASSLTPGATCIFGLTFKPQSSGAASAQLQITDSAATEPQIIYLQGTGTQ